MIAQSKYRTSEYNFRDQLLRLVSSAETAYWDVIEARENLKVQEQSLKMSDTSLKLYQKELELGALSPLDIYLPQSQYAAAETAVTRARYSLAQAEDALRKQIGADLDPQIRSLPIVLTEAVLPPSGGSALDREAAVQRAISRRPDLKAASQSLDVDELQIKQSTNSLRPDLALTGNYNAQGRGGTYLARNKVFGDTGLGGTVTTTIPGGMGDALNQLFGFGFPTYAFGLQLTLPIRDRRVHADLADALVQKRLDTLAVRNLEQNIRLQVLNAISQVESAKASIKSATAARDFAQKALEAEQKKYELGTTTLYFVLDAESRFVTAQSQLLTQSISYRRSMLNLLRMTGELLEERGITIK
jgi:outer membrane protein TolC